MHWGYMKDRRVIDPETGKLVFPEREPLEIKIKIKPYSCDYHTGGMKGQELRDIIKAHNDRTFE